MLAERVRERLVSCEPPRCAVKYEHGGAHLVERSELALYNYCRRAEPWMKHAVRPH
jgi:hypothetical protein